MKPQTIREIEEQMADVMTSENIPYQPIVDEFHRLLSIMGNADGDELIALTLVAMVNSVREG